MAASIDWAYFLVMSLFLFGSNAIILHTPLYLQRPLAFGLFAMAIPLSLYAFAPTIGLEWFIPFLFLKLLVSHLLREEPYQPLTVRPANG